MASVPKKIGCTYVTIRLGANQTFEINADGGVNTPEVKTAYHGSTALGTSLQVLESVLAKLVAALHNEDSRAEFMVDDTNNQIVG